MIQREDMLELTRRMTLKRNSMDRIAGCYLDGDGDFDGSFNTSFLGLSTQEKEKNIALAKIVPFSDTNRRLKDYTFSEKAGKRGGIRQLLMAMKECGLKNDAVMDIFYELISEKYHSTRPYSVFVFHGRYDVPVKTSDKERQWESEEVYEYLICVISPLDGEYEPGEPECGFIFPAFMDRSSDNRKVLIYQADPDRPHEELTELLCVKRK